MLNLLDNLLTRYPKANEHITITKMNGIEEKPSGCNKPLVESAYQTSD